MALTRGSKPWWVVHVASGVVAVALITFGVAQCSGKKSEREEKEAKKSELVEVQAKADELSAQVEDMHHQIDDLKSDNEAMSDTIDMQRDSIATLNDSLSVVNEELTDCRNSKRKPAKSAPSKKIPPKPQSKPVVAVKPDTVIVVQQPVTNPGCGGNVNVNLNNSQNNGAIVAGGNMCKTDIKLDNGSVNNGVIVVGNGNNVVVNAPAAVIAADTLARARKIHEVEFTAVFVTRSK